MREDFRLAIETLRGAHGSTEQRIAAIGVGLTGLIIFWLVICAFMLMEPLP